MRVEPLVASLLACASIVSAAAPPAAKRATEKKTMNAAVEEWKGQNGGPPEPGHRLISDLKGWESLAAQLKLGAAAPDFARSVVVAVFVGERPTGGFTAVFEPPLHKGDDLIVRYRIQTPSPDAFVTQAFASPWKARVFARPKGKVLVEPIPG